MLTPLPIDAVMSDIVRAVRTSPAIVLEAPPGAGKTTRVPSALLDAGLAGSREIVVLQPRRLATRLAANRVADERGERVGETIGYQVRFDDMTSAKTRIRFVTEGVLTRRLVSEPKLDDVGVVVLDEFHERHLAGDLALAMLRRMQQTTRPDLKLVVMSATLDAAPIAKWLGDAPSLRSEGRRFDVALEHLDREDDRQLDVQVAGALKRLLQRQLDGHVLVFLPGGAEIRRAQDACADVASRHGLELHVLHGELTAQEQDRALKSSSKRKVILSTNVAETSVTIDGVAAVIDSGLARIAAHSPWSGLPTLKLAKISKASATQRAGRAGRTREGVCLRLYTKADYDGRAQLDTPEIRRLDFAEAALALRSWGVRNLSEFPWFEAPPAATIAAADELLRKLGATDESGGLTAIGKQLVTYAVHPRQARVMLEARALGVAEDGAAIAALLGERELRLDQRARPGASRKVDALAGPSDVLELLERFKEGQAMGARAAGVDAAVLSSVERVKRQLLRGGVKGPSSHGDLEHEAALLRSILSGYPDRVARRRKAGAPELVLSGGGSATLDPTSVVHDAELMVALDAEERRGGVFVRLASKVDAEWLLDLPASDLRDTSTLKWNSDARRVEQLTGLSYGKISIEETRRPAPPSEETSKVLAEAALAAPIGTFCNPETLTAWRCRVEALRTAFPEANFPTVDDAFLRGALTELCEGANSFSELESAGLMNTLQAKLSSEQARLLHTQAPERVTLGGGRTVQVHYEPARPPWIESRLQDFFGTTKGPMIGRSPLVLHLLAPNHQAVQVTTDLAGFWDRHYPAVRRELMRQYPKHSWPEDPRTAAPPQPRPPRRS